jgi:hypothetical protein
MNCRDISALNKIRMMTAMQNFVVGKVISQGGLCSGM